MKKTALNIDWSAEVLIQHKITRLERDWLFNGASLTHRLTQLSNNQFSVEVLSASRQLAREDESQKLGITSERQCWVREVLLCGANEAWVYARSVALETNLNHTHYNLNNIGSKPLGAILFSDDSFKRTPLEVAHYPMSLLPSNQQYPDLWARRSSFINNEINVLVQEIFLPSFWQKLQRK